MAVLICVFSYDNDLVESRGLLKSLVRTLDRGSTLTSIHCNYTDLGL